MRAVILALLLVGCGEGFYPSYWQWATQVCEANGGVHRMWIFDHSVEADCNNTAEFTINKEKLETK